MAVCRVKLEKPVLVQDERAGIYSMTLVIPKEVGVATEHAMELQHFIEEAVTRCTLVEQLHGIQLPVTIYMMYAEEPMSQYYELILRTTLEACIEAGVPIYGIPQAKPYQGRFTILVLESTNEIVGLYHTPSDSRFC
ncbi:hypothetical protein GMRT_16319 [Giardia muris]|uniref:Uncharacterized protein n=1 Tax=Giardia muris TaxID=5742 RepID=A0A4Z1SXX5_GIAMU|nr:hypothetical protein GMRT_16319 [Giardia muris]|eukprot:TNJ29665.1 hypothetical protein GMRT_16319 [Giardia muris]